MKSSLLFFLSFFFLIQQAQGESLFLTGANLKNEDSVSHFIEYKEPLFTAAVCEARKGSPYQRGLDSAFARKYSKGFRIQTSIPYYPPSTVIAAEIAPQSFVPCLCVRGCVIQLNGKQSLKVSGGKTAVIRKGKLFVEK